MGFAKADTGGSRASVSAPNPVYGAGRARAMCDVSGSTMPARSRFAIKLAIFASLSAKAVGACGSVLQGRLQASRRTLPQRPLGTLIGKYPLSACLSTVFLPSSSSSRAYNTRSRLVAWRRAINGGGATRWLKHRAAPKPQLEASHAAIYRPKSPGITICQARLVLPVNSARMATKINFGYPKCHLRWR